MVKRSLMDYFNLRLIINNHTVDFVAIVQLKITSECFQGQVD